MISEMVRNIAVLVLLALFMELLIPFGELSRFIRMVMGLVLLAAVLNPVLGMLKQEALLPSFQKEDYSEETAAILDRGEELAAQMEDQALSEYRQSTVSQIEALASLVDGVKSVEASAEVDSQGVIQKVSLLVTKSTASVAQGELKNKIIDTISRFYGIDPSKFEINISEEVEA